MKKQFNMSSSVRLWRAGDLRLWRMPLRYLLFILLITACDNTTDPPPPTVCEDIPQQDQIGLIVPITRFINGKLAPDGKTIAYSMTPMFDLFFYDIETGKQSKLPPLKFPDSIRLANMAYFQWCPYDPDLLVIDVYTFTDTSGNWSKYILAMNSYIIKRDGTILSRVTPSKYPSWGAKGGYSTVAWLLGSNRSQDSLLISSVGIYIPQSDSKVTPTYWQFSHTYRWKSLVWSKPKRFP